MPFHSLDKALTDRMIRYVMQMASELKGREAPAGFWPKTTDGRKAKRLFDIYGRDAADLKALQAKMIRDHADQDMVDQMARRKAAKPQKLASQVPLVGEVNQHEHPLDDKGMPPASDLQRLAASSPVVFQNQRQVDWQSDAHAAGLEMEEFEQGPRHPPGDLTDQAALVVGNNG